MSSLTTCPPSPARRPSHCKKRRPCLQPAMKILIDDNLPRPRQAESGLGSNRSFRHALPQWDNLALASGPHWHRSVPLNSPVPMPLPEHQLNIPARYPITRRAAGHRQWPGTGNGERPRCRAGSCAATSTVHNPRSGSNHPFRTPYDVDPKSNRILAVVPPTPTMPTVPASASSSTSPPRVDP